VHAVDDVGAPAPIRHHLLTVTAADRTAVVGVLAGGEYRTLVFSRTRRGAERLASQLSQAGTPAAELHGNLSQPARERSLRMFSSGTVRVLVATDVAARGIHVDRIDLVIHADPPAEHKAYLHRSGRTARAGASGVVITLQTLAQAKDVRAVMRKAGVVPLAASVVPESTLLRSIAGEPAEWVNPAPRSAPARRTGRPKARARGNIHGSAGNRTGRSRADDWKNRSANRNSASGPPGQADTRQPAARPRRTSRTGQKSGSGAAAFSARYRGHRGS
jgi:superfamily II DNA/RNA helicase